MRDWLRRLRRHPRETDAVIHVDPHRDPVGHRHAVSGRIDARYVPFGVQVLVTAHDGRRYLQAPAVVRGERWHASVCCGYPDSTGEYTVVAVTGAKLVKSRYEPDEPLPAGAICSPPIRVTRRN